MKMIAFDWVSRELKWNVFSHKHSYFQLIVNMISNNSMTWCQITELTTVATHQFHNTNAILNTWSLHMGCINCTLGLLNSSIKTKGFINDLIIKEETAWENQRWKNYSSRNQRSSNRTCGSTEREENYSNVIIYCLRNSSNSNFESPPLTLLHELLGIKRHACFIFS